MTILVPRLILHLLLFAGVFLLVYPLSGAQKRPEEEKPQVLELVPEAPDFVKVETSRLGYLSLPVEQRGLLSRQVEESMKSLRRLLGKRKVLRITAWVGGAGDTRRVSMSIRELLAKWRIPIPAITVIRVGALPNPASRVAFDVEVAETDAANPHGLMFLAGVRSEAPEFRFEVAPEVERSLDILAERLAAEAAKPEDVLQARCFVSLTQDMRPLELAVRKRFPRAQVRLLQGMRSTVDSYATCDLVARLSSPPAQALEARVLTPRENEPPITSLVKTNAPALILTSAQLGFRATDADLALAFERLESTLKKAGSSLSNTAQLSILAESVDLGRRTEAQGRKYLDSKHDPAILRATVEDLPALDATLSLDAIAILP
ncbi:MAG: hypothetical protein IT170_00580 [Bryobacterales bacterium]|nr:hypothetical protein [Bryobacterales bacterium]